MLDAAASSASQLAGAPFLPADAPAGACRNTPMAQAPAIHPAAPWFSETPAHDRHSHCTKRCVMRSRAVQPPGQRQSPSPATVREFDGNSYSFPLLPLNEFFELFAQRFISAEQQ